MLRGGPRRGAGARQGGALGRSEHPSTPVGPPEAESAGHWLRAVRAGNRETEGQFLGQLCTLWPLLATTGGWECQPRKAGPAGGSASSVTRQLPQPHVPTSAHQTEAGKTEISVFPYKWIYLHLTRQKWIQGGARRSGWSWEACQRQEHLRNWQFTGYLYFNHFP